MIELVAIEILTDEQLSDALTAALATDDARSTAVLIRQGAYLDPPEGVQQLLNEYKRRHRRDKVERR